MTYTPNDVRDPYGAIGLTVRLKAAFIAQPRDEAGLRRPCRQSWTRSAGRPTRRPDRGIRNRLNQH